MRDTAAAIAKVAHNKLEKQTPVRLRMFLLMGVLMFAIGMLVGRLRTIQSPISTCNLSNVAAVFLDNPNTDHIEKWEFTNGQGTFDYQDKVLFLTIQGELEGPFLVAKTQDN